LLLGKQRAKRNISIEQQANYGGSAMFRYALAALAAIVLIAANLVPDDAFARRGGGGGLGPAIMVIDRTHY
jgi:hypothetical protein